MGGSQKYRKAKVWLGWALLVGSLISWPLAIFWFAKTEPPFVVSLSELALVIESLSLITASEVHEEQGEKDEGQ
jgi:hypothetical protein